MKAQEKEKLFAVLTFLILGFGFLPLAAQTLPYVRMDWLSYGSLVYYGDAYEPDDSRFDAKKCAVDGPIQFHDFHVADDQDWIWFNTQSGSFYAIVTSAHPMGSLADTVLELYNSDGALVASDDDGGPFSDAILTFKAAYTGVYYGRVTEWGNRHGDAFWYHVNVVELELEPRQYLPMIVRRHS